MSKPSPWKVWCTSSWAEGDVRHERENTTGVFRLTATATDVGTNNIDAKKRLAARLRALAARLEQ